MDINENNTVTDKTGKANANHNNHKYFLKRFFLLLFSSIDLLLLCKDKNKNHINFCTIILDSFILQQN
jgi:hypothetical protein